MNSLQLHGVKKIKVGRYYQEDNKIYVLNMDIDTERYGVFHISFFGKTMSNLQIIHEEVDSVCRAEPAKEVDEE